MLRNGKLQTGFVAGRLFSQISASCGVDLPTMRIGVFADERATVGRRGMASDKLLTLPVRAAGNRLNFEFGRGGQRTAALVMRRHGIDWRVDFNGASLIQLNESQIQLERLSHERAR